jgi:hypothetical protein
VSRRRAAARIEPTAVPSDPPVVMADVVRELEAIAAVAATHDEPELVRACERARALVLRLRDQFVFEITGPASPSELPIDLDEVRERRRPFGSLATKVPAAR